MCCVQVVRACHALFVLCAGILYLRQVVDGMLYLHNQSIMHRDLTLSNLLLASDGSLRIADFGLATQLRRPDDRHTTMCGTPNYMRYLKIS